ncbi:MAG TPA: hypothetical protein VJ863_05855 [Sphaerochaeta sp.]|nr:hypothetical protein [Sphaerochaeta sp.]
MKKRIVLGSVLIMVMLLPAFAAPVARSSWATGINLGTGVQSAAQYRINDGVDIIVGIGLDFWYNAIYGDVVANFRVGGFNIEQAAFDVTVGGGVLVGLYDQKVELSVVAPVGVTYRFPEEVIPLDLYIRVGPAIRILKGYQANVLGLYSYIGAMYRF